MFLKLIVPCSGEQILCSYLGFSHIIKTVSKISRTGLNVKYHKLA